MPPIALHALDAQVAPSLGDFADSEDLLFIQLPPVASLAALKEVRRILLSYRRCLSRYRCTHSKHLSVCLTPRLSV